MTAALLLAGALFLQASGDQQPPADPPPIDGNRLAVYLITIGPGPAIWERFGHNAIWIRDTVTGEGIAYDYGNFSFAEPGFVANFARGRMLYWMGRRDGVALVNFYVGQRRSVALQELALPPERRALLQERLEANYEADRGRYRYDYYRDNCSTRIRDALDAVAGGAIRAALDTVVTATSYRWHTRRSLENNPLYHFAVDAGLGPAADLPVTRLQETFLPQKLQEYLREVHLAGSDGRPVPLVQGEIAVSESDPWPVAPEPADWTLRFLVAGILVGGTLFSLGRRGRSAGWARRLFGVLAGTWVTASAAGGALLVYLAFLSDHLIAFRNENVLQFNLLAVALLPFLPGALRGRPGRGRPAVAFAVLVAAMSLFGVVAKGLPGWGQANQEILALAVPIHLGVAAGLLAAVRFPTPAPSAAPPSPR